MQNPKKHDYDAAKEYLELLGIEAAVVDELKECPVTRFKAKDVIRASELPLLDVSNFHVRKNLKKIEDGDCISPILLIADRKRHRLIIADGYHRACAVYRFNEDAYVPCQIIRCD